MKSMHRGFALTSWVMLVTGLLAACASPSPAPILLTLPPSTAPAAAASAPGAAASAPVLAVRRVNIPEYLAARRVRYRSEASTLAEWPNTYWAERIEIGVSREFISALRQQLPGWTLCESNCADRSPNLWLQVDLVPMDFVRPTQTLQARARIAVSGGGATPAVLQTQDLSYSLPAAADTAQSQAQAIAELIRQVAATTATMVQAARP
jgi:uncharacterized lipoprotein YmbA